MTYRVGRTLGRTIYEQVGDDPSKGDTFIGIMDTRELAEMVVSALNARGGPQPFRPLPWQARNGEQDEALPVDTTLRQGPRCLHGGPGTRGDLCTLPPHHAGFHRAGDGVVVIAEWAS